MAVKAGEAGHRRNWRRAAASPPNRAETLKTQLRRAAEVLGVDRLPQNEKRATLAWTAIDAGAVTPRDLIVSQ
jgi:hypothetical protein